MAVQDIRDAMVVRERDMFLLTDTAGNVPRGNPNGFGLYYQDTRYLSGSELSFSTARPLLLLSTAELGYGSEHVMTNPSMVDAAGRRIPRGTVNLRRQRVIDDVLEETIYVTNHNHFAVTLELVIRLAADFADIFEVRGYEPEHRGQVDPPAYQDGMLAMHYHGTEGRRRQTLVSFTPEPDSVLTDPEVSFVTYRLPLAAQERTVLRSVVSVDGRIDAPLGDERFAGVAESYSRWRSGTTRVTSGNAFFDAVIERSLNDLRMLWHPEPAGPCYPAAGTPWYDALFGRDSCITGLQTLAFKPEIAKECLASLAKWQGKKFDPWRDEEPGKILHELRHGELTVSGELPFSPYYGSIDSTPLFLVLAGEYYRWTGDLEFMRALRPNIEAALHWLDKYGDRNGDGYIEYEKRSVKGLVNQGWKDSADSMVHRDGKLAKPPIALVEVQAYAYAGARRAAEVLDALGENSRADQLRSQACELAKRFNRDFWMDDEGCYALAIGGRGVVTSVTSDAGHALWGGIASREQAEATAQRLMQPDMFSGWGIRTLTSSSPRYNPQGYHLGTIWPHDNSVVAMGLKRYGHTRELNVIARSLYEAARLFPYYRLPELFGGSDLSPHQRPVPYPVACRPQAWAAGAFPLITQAVLGLCPDAANKRLYVVAPELPSFLDSVRVESLCVGEAEVSLQYNKRLRATSVKVVALRGELDVRTVEEWPEELL